MPARPMSSSAIPSAGSITARRDADVRAKAAAARRAGLAPIVCVGETQDEREAGKTLAVVRRQLRGSVPERRDRRATSSSPTSRSGRSAPG